MTLKDNPMTIDLEERIAELLEANRHYVEVCNENAQLKAEIEKLKEAIGLYIILRSHQQFAPPEVFSRISQITGKEYKKGHSIGRIDWDLEQVLKGK